MTRFPASFRLGAAALALAVAAALLLRRAYRG